MKFRFTLHTRTLQLYGTFEKVTLALQFEGRSFEASFDVCDEERSDMMRDYESAWADLYSAAREEGYLP